ncbi:MAG: LamG domain-containing protein [Opitutaceae bacterium]|jgi:hypothetical protein|nr:LamG domain-containing protein [Opitutaceae bacterium]
MRLFVLATVWLLFAALSPAQPYVAGQTYFGRNDYIEYRAGDLPVIITAGHGGNLTPAEIPDRTYGTTVTDTNTRELAIACYDEIVARTGRRPHLIISHLRRTKLDPNREIVEAAQGNVFAEQAWREFHAFVEASRQSARAEFGFGHVFDLHGHGHDIQRVELGYALGNPELNVTDAALQHPGYAWMSTLRTLALARPGLPFPELLRGPRSLGDLLTRRGAPAWPSPDWPSPGTADFFNGGYIVRAHSCLVDNDTVHGVQLETHWTGLRDSAASRADFASSFAGALQPYLWDNYGYSLGTLSLSRFDPPSASVLARGGAPLVLTVRRTGWLGLSTNLAFTLGGTAVRGTSGDYTSSLSTNVFFAAGQTTAEITLTPRPAGPAFGDRTITLTLAPTATQTADTTPLTLVLGDGVSQIVRGTALDAAVSESAPAARFRLTRTQAASALTVPLQWSGTARPGADYDDAPAAATFPAGALALDVLVPLIDDGRPEPGRTLTLAVATGATHLAGLPASASIEIRDDDLPSGLSAWLRGDLEGNIARDSAGLARHATTLPANNADASGPAATFVASAGQAPALAFDGVDDTVALPRFTPDPAGDFTLAFFFRLDPSGTVSQSNLVSYGTRSAPGSLHLYFATTNVSNGTVSLRTNLPGLATNALDVARTSPLTWFDGVWRHYALSVGADGTARVYIDGVLRRTATGRTGSLAAGELFWLGWQPSSGASGGFLTGGMRDIRIYQRALPHTELSALALGRISYASWLAANALPSGSAATADSDGDGLPLFLEYGLAAHPLRPAAAPRHRVGLDAGRLTLTFLRETDASDLVWTIEGTDQLGAWQPLARRTSADSSWTILSPGAAVVESEGGVRFTDSVPFALRPGRFLRVRVSAP